MSTPGKIIAAILKSEHSHTLLNKGNKKSRLNQSCILFTPDTGRSCSNIRPSPASNLLNSCSIFVSHNRAQQPPEKGDTENAVFYLLYEPGWYGTNPRAETLKDTFKHSWGSGVEDVNKLICVEKQASSVLFKCSQLHVPVCALDDTAVLQLSGSASAIPEPTQRGMHTGGANCTKTVLSINRFPYGGHTKFRFFLQLLSSLSYPEFLEVTACIASSNLLSLIPNFL